MTISVAPDEQSSVTTHLYNHLVPEEVEHLQGVDLYHFPVTDGTRIQLTIESPAGSQQAWYRVYPDEIVPGRSSLDLDIVHSSESLPLDSVYTQEALTHYADQIPHWLGETSRDKNSSDFGR